MPNITQLPTITQATDATTFVVVDNVLTRRLSYSSIKNQLITDIAASIPLSALTDVNVTTPTDGQVLKYSSGQNKWIASSDLTGGGGGVTGLSSRTTAAATTTIIANNATGNVSITGFKSYTLLAIETNTSAWVRLYTSSAARTSDSTRIQTTDPTPGSGVIAEVITSGAQKQLMTPGVFGFNNDGTPSTTIYAAVTNLSGVSAALTVTLTLLQLEA
jgi:hypothetical protein